MATEIMGKNNGNAKYINVDTDGNLKVSKTDNMLGEYGFEYISNTVAHTPGTGKVFVAIQIVSDAVFSELLPSQTGNTFTGETIPVGTIIYGRFTSITLTSGKVIAYKGV